MTKTQSATSINWRTFLVSHPESPKIGTLAEGTELTAERLLEELAAGRTVEEIQARYAGLTSDAIRAVFAFAAERVHERYPGPTTDDFFEGPEWAVIDD